MISAKSAVVTTLSLVIILVVFFGAFNGAYWTTLGIDRVQNAIHPNSPPIDATWVQQFMIDVNSNRASSPLSYDPNLDNFSELRFETMVSNYEISHYGFQADVATFFGKVPNQIAVGEVVYFPAGETSPGYAQSIETSSPGHWQTMMDPAYHRYGYYLGQGPAFEVNRGCPNAEVAGPNINESQYFSAEGCTYSIVSLTWLVIDFEN